MPRLVSWPIAVVPLFFAGMSPALALAHGDFPETIDVAFRSGGDALPEVLSTFGLFIPRSSDHWDWICEEVVGNVTITDYIPLDTGRSLLATAGGLFASDDLCRWARVEGGVASTNITHMVQSDDGDVWLSSVSSAHSGALWRSEDGGVNFEEAWPEIFTEGAQLTGFALGEDGLPAFATGALEGEQSLWWRKGEVWTRHAPAASGGDLLISLGLDVGGIAPAYVALRTGAGDAIAKVSAAGEITELIHRETFSDFALSFVAGPAPGQLRVGGKAAGLFISTDGGDTFGPAVNPPSASCLLLDGESFYQCTDNYFDGAALISHGGNPDEGQAVMAFGQVRQTLSCPEGTTVHDTCEPLWDLVAAVGLNQVDETPTPTQSQEASPEPTEIGAEGSGGCSCDGGEISGAALLLVGWGGRRRRRSQYSARS